MKVFRKKEAPPVRGKDISGPTMVKHEGHFGFSDQGFSVRNLPPEWAALFTGINQELKNLGQKGITKREAKFLLKEFAKRMPPTVPDEPTSPRPTSPIRGGLTNSTGSNSSMGKPGAKMDPKAAECEQLKLMIRSMEERHRSERKNWMLQQQSAAELGGPGSGVGVVGIGGRADEERVKKLKEEKSKLESDIHQMKCEYDSLQAQVLALQTELNLMRSEKQILTSSSSGSTSSQELEKLRLQVVNLTSQLSAVRTSMENALQRTQEKLDLEIQTRNNLAEELAALKSADFTQSALFLSVVQGGDNPLSPRGVVSRPSGGPPSAPPSAPAPPPPPAPAPPPPPAPGKAPPGAPSPVSRPLPSNRPPPTPPPADSRGSLLDSIKNPENRQLRKVEPQEPKPEAEAEGILGALTKALLDRRAAIRDTEEEEEDDEVDWD